MRSALSIVIPTYGRERVLVDTIQHLLSLPDPADEIVVMDQTEQHEAGTEAKLSVWNASGAIVWVRHQPAGHVGALNRGLNEAKGEWVLFLDDDIVPAVSLISAHRRAHEDHPQAWAVVGQVLQPGQTSDPGPYPALRHRHSFLRRDLDFRFNRGEPAWVENVITCNLSVRREKALFLGGFDEGFVPPVSFRAETELAKRIIAAGGRIRFEPDASVRHLRAERGGTRIGGGHLASASPVHGVGDYYYALKHGRGWDRIRYMARRPFREVCTRFHLRHPWWIPVKLIGEARALCWARRLFSNRWKKKGDGFPIVGNADDQRHRVLLIHTSAPDRPNGSMVRYGAMVRDALTLHAGDRVIVEEINLAPRQSWLNRFPASLQTALRYWFIAGAARRRLPRHPGAVWHLLDGSHAYAIGAVRKHASLYVVTVHDTIPLLRLQGQWPGARPGRVGGWLIAKTASNWTKAGYCVADSGNTRDDLIRHAAIPADRIQVVHPALLSVDVSHDRVPIEGRYVLHVAGNNTFYKNRAGVVDMVKRIRESEPVQLVMAGAPPDKALMEHVRVSGMTGYVTFRSNISEQELAQLYRHAAFLLFPSLYEGFGWPPLEAMREGCPVLCSNVGSLPEIVGDAAWTADPKDVARFAELGLRMLRDESARSELMEQGRAHVLQFNMKALAEGLVRAYDQVAGRMP